MKRVYMKQFYAIIIMLLFFPFSGFPETKEIISEGTYNMGDGETPGVAESRALLNAKRIAIERAGTYIESYSKVKNMQFTEDEVKVLTSGLMEVTILHKKRTVVGDGIHFYVKIKAKVNPDKMEEMARKVKEKSVVDDYKKIQEAYDKSQRVIAELKKQMAKTKGKKENKTVEAKIRDDERLFQVNDWISKGYNYSINGEYDKALEAYNAAMVLEPNNAKVYLSRGNVYFNKGALEMAITDYNKAVAIDPNFDLAYLVRGIAHYEKGQPEMAILDCTKAIGINPNLAAAYLLRGTVYVDNEQYDKAINDFTRLIDKFYDEICYRAEVCADVYYRRGYAYFHKTRVDAAIKDLSKSLNMDSNNAKAFAIRGLAYLVSGNTAMGIQDLEKSCGMGNKAACEAIGRALQNK